MKSTTVSLIASVAALASAQTGVTFNNNGTFTCAVANGTYCAGVDSNIIIRCTNGIGQPGNCNDNLAGYPPLGVNFSPCYNCTANDGRAACSKNGIVYPASGSGLGTVQFSVNDTSVCSAITAPPAPAPYSNSTTSVSPYANGTSTVSVTSAPAPTGGYASASTSAASASSTASSAAGASSAGASSPSASSTIVPYTGAATNVQMISAGALLGFAALFAGL